MKLELPASARQILEYLHNNGFEAFAVGGCVRDALLGQKPKDWDICTSALPEEMLACFGQLKTLPTGLAHGTVTVLVEGEPIEVTTYRIDGSYSDGRHPDGVTFTDSLAADLARRDFTMNAMAYHPAIGLIDLYNGQQDLKNGIIRCVGDPSKRFEEDALRILRALRFASVLDFSLQSETEKAVDALAPSLTKISAERIFQELCKLLCGKAAKGILDEHIGVLRQVLPFSDFSHEETEALQRLPEELALRFAMLYRGNVNAKKALEQLRAPRRLTERVALLAQWQCEPLPDNLPAVRRMVGTIGMEASQQLLCLWRAAGKQTEGVSKALIQIQQQKLCCCIADLAVSGNDLLAGGIVHEGRQIGVILQELLQAVVNEVVENRKEDLLLFACKQILHKS